ncbi:MAG: serine/threonine protein kinase [Candidatus Obscuribacterales bacterium]|nr:serine/threonine protein kinase [Candidatus Obscuribacterales bacterium]
MSNDHENRSGDRGRIYTPNSAPQTGSPAKSALLNVAGSWEMLNAPDKPPKLSIAEDSLIGSVIEGKYKILDILGRGAMAVVYLGKQLSTGRLVAVKRLSVHSTESIVRFSREIRNHAKLQHKNIVESIEFAGSTTGNFFMIMELVEGPSLLDIMKGLGHMDCENFTSIMFQACDALAYAHEHGIVHRDLKLSNIVILREPDTDGIVVKVLDFGIAQMKGEQRITLSGRAVGSPLYMSPEQCSGKKPTTLSDIYSLGICAYELLVGHTPYINGALRDILRSHCNPDINPTPVSELVSFRGVHLMDQILLKALQTDPAQRWQNASDLKEAIAFWYEAAKSGNVPSALPESVLIGTNPFIDLEQSNLPTSVPLADRYMEEEKQFKTKRKKPKKKLSKRVRSLFVMSLIMIICLITLAVMGKLQKFF